MDASVYTIDRQGDRWGVSANGEVLALARTKKEARALAKAAAGMLLESEPSQVKVGREPRSFRPGD